MLPFALPEIRGTTNIYTIVSDGTHRPHFVWLLQELDFVLRVTRAAGFFAGQFLHATTSRTILTGHSLPNYESARERPALYLRPEYLFFPGAVALADLLLITTARSLICANCQVAGDERLLRDPAKRPIRKHRCDFLFARNSTGRQPSNGFNHWVARQIFSPIKTVTHLAMHSNGPVHWIRQVRFTTWTINFSLPRYANEDHPAPLRQSVRHKLGTDLFVNSRRLRCRLMRILTIVDLPWDTRAWRRPHFLELSRAWAAGRARRFALLFRARFPAATHRLRLQLGDGCVFRQNSCLR